jgi:antitoxin (DNA-binding transcriptional repressor) of toxin-antitoxin stability system
MKQKTRIVIASMIFFALMLALASLAQTQPTNAEETLYKVCMQTLTITDAKKNLGRWLQEAARGKDIGIVSGADIIALRKVQVASADYAAREYGVTDEQLDAFGRATDERFQKLKRTGKLTITTHAELKELLEKAARD